MDETRLSHYLYFLSEIDAEAAAELLRADRYDAEVTLSADGERQWLVLASTAVIGEAEADISELRDYFERLCQSLHGEYDGWEIGPLDGAIDVDDLVQAEGPRTEAGWFKRTMSSALNRWFKN